MKVSSPNLLSVFALCGDNLRLWIGIEQNHEKKRFPLILLVYSLCGILVFWAAPELSWVLSFLCFFILSALLYSERVVPIRQTVICSLFQIPSFLLISSFFDFAKSFVESGQYLFALLSVVATLIGILINVYFSSLTYLFYLSKHSDFNSALFDAFQMVRRHFSLICMLTIVSFLILIAIFLNTELTIFIAYPFWLLLAKSLGDLAKPLYAPPKSKIA